MEAELDTTSYRELLRAAARAAGYEVREERGGGLPWTVERGGKRFTWNPLEDDGDAFRLMVELDMNVFQVAKRAYAMPSESDGTDEQQVRYGDSGGDKFAATRRAIVRAAAAMATEEKQYLTPENEEPVLDIGGYDFDAMCEAFDRLIEAHAQSAPFHNPVCADARMALRILRGMPKISSSTLSITHLTKTELEKEFFRICDMIPERRTLTGFDSFVDGARTAERIHSSRLKDKQ